MEEENLIRTKRKVWNQLGKLKKWPDRTSFNDVIEFLIKEYREKEYTKRLLK